MFYGRKEELEILKKRFESEHFEFGFVYGQRRIGKTALIDEFSKNYQTLMFFASDSSDIDIRNDFTSRLMDYVGMSGISSYRSWDEFFKALYDLYKDKKVLLVFDEYPNIIVGRDGKKKKTDFDDKLQDAIDHLFKNTKISILLMGSNVSFMDNLIKDKNGPLYKRHTFSLLISKLKWEDALNFVEGMSLDDKVKTLSLTDTYPYYLSHINPELSFEDNLNAFFYNRDSLVTVDPTFSISSNVATTGFYVGIMKCLSRKINTIKEIGNALDAESGKVSIYIDELVKGGVVTKSSYFNSARNTYYEINDRMTSFYFRFIQPYVEYIKLGDGLRIKEKEGNAINSFIDKAYEKLCISYLKHLNSDGRLERYFLDFSNFRADNTSLNRSVEIDIVAEDDRHLLVGECKFSKNKKGIKEYLNLKEDVSIKPFDRYIDKFFYIFSHSGFNEELEKLKDKNLHLISSSDMVTR